MKNLQLPEDINLSLMEILEAAEYPVAATFGGMALCATCLVEIVHGADQVPAPLDIELDMIDTVPNASENSRLACQLRLGSHLHGTRVALRDSML